MSALTDWQNLGAITTANGMFAIVAPDSTGTLGKHWKGRKPRPLVQFEEVEQTAFLFGCNDGLFDVEGRFCDLDNTGHLTLCEVRIRLHFHHEDAHLPDPDGEE